MKKRFTLNGLIWSTYYSLRSAILHIFWQFTKKRNKFEIENHGFDTKISFRGKAE